MFYGVMQMDLETAKEIILDHAKNPRNRIAKIPCDESNFDFYFGEAKNPICGDRVSVYLKSNDSSVQNCFLILKACSMCTASASLMSENIKSLSFFQAKELCNSFSTALLDLSSQEWPEALIHFEAFSYLRKNPVRLPCALLPWTALKHALQCQK
jgi:nitrogen fixation NifU-like protein